MASRSHVTHFLWAVTHFVVVRYDERQGHYLWKDEIPWVSLQCSGLGQPRALRRLLVRTTAGRDQLQPLYGVIRTARRLSGHPAEHAREGGGALVADLQRHALDWLAPREKLARNRHAPDGKIVDRRLANPCSEMLSEPRA